MKLLQLSPAEVETIFGRRVSLAWPHFSLRLFLGNHKSPEKERHNAFDAEALEWCRETIPKEEWTYESVPPFACLYVFKSKRHHMLFKLRFSA